MFSAFGGDPPECTCSVNNSSHKWCTCVWVTEILHSAGDEPKHKMHLCQSSLSRARSAHNTQMSLYKIPGSVFSHTTSHLPKFWTELPQRDNEIWGRSHLLDSSVVFETGLVYSICVLHYFFFIWHDSLQWARASSFTRFSRSHSSTHHSR